ncbi:VWA domain-containing protein [Desulfoplanes sp.]
MTFTHPDLLYLLWLIPGLVLLFVYGRKRRTRNMDGFGRGRTLTPISRRPGPLAAWAKHGLIITSMVCMTIGLAGLQRGHTWERIERKGVSLVLALDCSRSMLAGDTRPDRLQRAKWEIRDLLGMLHGDKVGLVAFAGTAFVQCPVTLDYSGFELFLQALTPGAMPVGGTDLGAAIKTAMDAFDPQEASEKAIILITDGEKTTGDPLEMAQQAADQNIKIFCIGIGRPEGAPIPGKDQGFVKDEQGQILLSRLDETTLQSIASLTGGIYVRSTTGDMDLDTIYNQEILGSMEASTLTGGKKKTSIDRYPWLVGLGLIALLTELLILSPKNALFGLCLLLGLTPVRPALAMDNPFVTQEGRGMTAYDNENYEQARTHFLGAQVDTPADPSLAYNLGNTAFRAEQYEDAASFYATAAGTDDPDLRHKALYNRGNALFRLNKHKEALTSYGQAAKLAPDDQDTRENIAFVKKLLEQQKQKKEQHQKKNNNKNQKDKKGQRGQDDRDKQSGKGPDNQQGKQKDPGRDQDQKQDNGNNKDNQDQNADGQQQSPDSTQKDQDGGKVDQSKRPDSIKEKDLPEQGDQQATPSRENRGQQQNPGGQPTARAHDKNMLNRLKDHPGKALVPRYGQKNVERDW